jgi:chromosome partitioning protein
MIVTIGNSKGGVGKTTLAVNLAVGLAKHGLNVLLVDGDEQATALAFTELRAAAGKFALAPFTTVALHAAAIRTQVRKLASNYNHVIIDVGGRDSGSLRAALTVSNLVLIPTAPRSFDLWGVADTAALVREAREVNDELRALAVLNGADPAGADNSEALAALEEIAGIEVSPHRIGRRKAFPNSAAAGLSVLEYVDHSNPDGVAKARAELNCILFSICPDLERKK